jgi:hypothetical protein
MYVMIDLKHTNLNITSPHHTPPRLQLNHGGNKKYAKLFLKLLHEQKVRGFKAAIRIKRDYGSDLQEAEEEVIIYTVLSNERLQRFP